MGSTRTWMFALIVLCCAAQRSQVAAQVTVSGEVDGPDYAGLAGTRLSFEQGDRRIAADTADDNGRYGVRLRPGGYDLSIAVPEGSPFGLWGRHSLQVEEATDLNIAFAASRDRQVRSGRVVDGAGRAMVGAYVSTAGGAFYADAQTDETGRFLIFGSAQTTSLRASCGSEYGCLDDRERSRTIAASVTLEPTPGPVTDIEIVLDYRILRGVVLDENGAPVAGALVSWGQGTEHGEATARIFTDAEGRFEHEVFGGVGYLTVVAQHTSEYMVDRRTITVDATEPEPPPVTVQLVLKQLETVAGTVVDGAGVGVANVTVSVELFETQTNDNGQFQLRAPPTGRWLSVRCGGGRCPSSTDSENFTIQQSELVDLTQGPVRDRIITLQARTLSGAITDNCGAAIAGMRVRWQQNTVLDETVQQAYSHDIALTDQHGRFSLNVLAGDGTLFVETDATMFAPVAKRIDIPSEPADLAPVDVELEPVTPATSVPLVASTGRVVDGRGRGIANAYISQGEFAPDGASSDETGAFELLTLPGASTLFALQCTSRGGCLAGSNPDQDLMIWLAWQENVFGTAPVRDARLVIDASTASITVIDSDGVAVPDVTVHWSQSAAPITEQDPAGALQNIFTTNTGNASFTVFHGTDGWMAVRTDRDRREVYVSLARVEEPQFLVVFPIVVDAASARVEAGDVVSTAMPGTSTSVDDPLETTLRATSAGVVSIHEHPFTTSAPAGYRYLAQEIAVTAPDASADDPLTIHFTLHASRVPDAASDSRLVVFHEQERIAACETEGAASPDPCLSERKRLSDDAVELTVRSSHAGTWIIGVDLTDEPEQAMRGAAGGGAELLLPTYRRHSAVLMKPTASSAPSDSGGFACNVTPNQKPKTLLLLLIGCAALVRLARRSQR